MLGRVLAVVVVLAFAGAVRAEDDKAVARKHLRDGDRHLKKGDRHRDKGREDKAIEEYEAALASYQAAYEAFPSPKIYFPIAQVEERLGRDLDAFHHYEKMLAEAGGELDDNLRAQVEMQIEHVKQRLGQIEFDVKPDGASVALDGEDLGVAPLPGPVVVAPGKHSYRVSKDGWVAYEGETEVAAGERPVEMVALEPIQVEQVADKPPEKPKPKKKRVATTPGRNVVIGGIAVTAGLTGLATITGIMATSEHGKYGDEALSAEDREAARDKGKSLALTTDLLLVGAVAAGAYTAYYYYKVYQPRKRADARRRERAAAVDVWVAPYTTGEQTGLAVGGSF